MTIHETRSHLVNLKLFGMVEGLDFQMATSSSSDLSFDERIGILVSHELTFRENNRLKTLLKMARLKIRAADLKDIDYTPKRNLDRSRIANLATCEWIRHGFNVLITGATGTGKTYLACALGMQSCLKGLPVQFHSMGAILDELKQARIDGSLRKRLKFFNRSSLLILDDLGIKASLTLDECELLFELIDNRPETGATIVTSQLPPSHWHGYLHTANPTAADAIMDRLFTNATKIELKGESLRPHWDILSE